jgi:tellurite resistance protein TehA-like permease
MWVERGFLASVWIAAVLSAVACVAALTPLSINWHLGLAIPAVLFVLFAQTAAIFYFVGTGIWIRDRSKELALQKDPAAKPLWQLYLKTQKFKAPTMPMASLGLALGFFVFVLGGASQVGAMNPWVHGLLGFLVALHAAFSIRVYRRYVRQTVETLDAASELLTQASWESKL